MRPTPAGGASALPDRQRRRASRRRRRVADCRASSARSRRALTLAQELEQIALREDRHLGLLRLGELRGAGLLAHHKARRLGRDRVGHLRAERLESSLRLVPGIALEGAGDDVRAAGERPFGRLLVLPRLEAQADGAQLLDQRPVLIVCEPVDDVLGAVGAEALDLGDLLGTRGHQLVDRAEVAREIAREDPADRRDVQAEEYTRERHLLGALDRLDRSGRRDLPEALELEQLLLRQAVKAWQRADEALLPQDADRLLADAVDVGDSGPVDQRLEAARRAGAVRAAVHRL